MRVLLSNEKSGSHEEPPSRCYLRASSRKSSKSGTLRKGKIIPAPSFCRLRNDWNGDASPTVSAAEPKEERVMYIGLGGILVLILILWLLGVI
jgi:hypothetical protein